MEAQSPSCIHLKTGHFLNLLCAVILSSCTRCLSLPDELTHSLSNSRIDSPLQNGHYILKLNSSSPDVLDSSVSFNAQLETVVGPVSHKKLFRYTWHNTANHMVWMTKDDFYADITRTFSSDFTDSGLYNMSVHVQLANCTAICPVIAKGSILFQLTDSLNGVLKIKQPSADKRFPNVYATGKPIKLYVNITDKFREPVEYTYKWLVNGEELGNTTKPKYKTRINNSGVYILEVRAEVDIDGLHTPPLLDAIHEGSFSKAIILKDPLDNITITGQKLLTAGDSIYKVRCSGSFPTSQCWKLTRITNTTINAEEDIQVLEDVVNTTCSPTLFLDTCLYAINVTLNTTGLYQLQVTLLNDVSLKTADYLIQVYSTGDESVLYLVPIVFISIATLIILMGLVYTMHVNRQKIVEVADFDFRRERENENIFKRMISSIRSQFSKHRYVREHRHAVFHESTAKNYGSFDVSL